MREENDGGVKSNSDSVENVIPESPEKKGSEEEPGGNGQPFPVVGVGSSAGGLEALKKFLTATPPNTGMAFVLIQHLDPTHESLMVDLLARYTTMNVVQIENDMPVEPDRIHIIPPGTSLTIKNGVLLLGKPIERRGMRMPVDNFFMSLAEDQQENAVCIILSGTGSDGTLGMKEIKARGGLAIVQDPETAQYDGMPRSAIMTGLVDYILPVEKIPETIVGYVRHSLKLDRLAEPLLTEAEEQLHRILTLLHVRTGHDFRYYKKNTLVRRLQRRMTVKHITSLGEYLEHVQKVPDELEALDKDLLISVTMFFREPEVWEALQETVIPKLIDRCSENQPVRIWVPGCATGEEAYSLAMMLVEEAERRKRECPVQIYATDIDKEALEIGRRGVYPENIAEQVSHDRLSRFFTRDANGMYQVNKRLREMVVFAPQNLISDPPFSKLDMVSCRNVLIYIQVELQKKVIALFHFALRDGGFLVLGNSESVGTRTDLFEPLSKRWRIFRQISAVGRIPLDLPLSLELGRRPGDYLYKPAVPLATRYAEIAKGQLIQKFTPPSVLVNSRYETLFFSGVTRDFLAIPEGAPTDNVIDMADPGLRPKLRTALYKAGTENREVVLGGIRLSHGDRSRTVKLTALPVIEGKEEASLFLITFEYEPLQGPGPVPRPEIISEESVIRSLEEELKRSREELQATIEQMETSNEELKASNEEVMSMNEELQSSNEELETSREELQSLNEELSTLNSQLQDKVNELEVTTDDLNNLLTSTTLATIFMSQDFRIKRFTPAATQLLNLIPGDIGRPMVDITRKFTDDALFDDATSVLHSLIPVTKEIRSDDGKWFQRRILPYRTQDSRIEGVVVTFSDITGIKTSERRIKQYAAIVESSQDAIYGKDLDGVITSWNKGAELMYGYTAEEVIGKSVTMLAPEERKDEVLNILAKIARGEKVDVMDTERVRKDGSRISVSEYVSPVKDEGGAVSGASAIARDITVQKKAEDALRASEQRLARAQEISNLGSWELDLATNTLTWSDEAYRIFGLQPQEFGATYETFLEVVHPDDRAAVDAAYSGSVRDGKDSYEIEHRIVRKATGEIRFVHEKCEHFHDASGRIIRSVGMVHDITERKRAEEALCESEARQQAILDNAPAVIYVKDLEGRYIFLNRSARAWMEKMGVDGKRAIGSTDSDLLPPEIAKTFAAGDRQMLDAAAATDEEELIVQPDGIHSYMENKFPLRDASGSIYAIAGIATDITERMRAEEEKAARSQELEELNRELEAFNYSISHDLRGPLRVMGGFVKALEEDYAGRLDDTGRDYLARIGRSALKMTLLIDGLLKLSKISRQKANRARVDMSTLAAGVISSLREEGSGRTVEVSIEEGLSASADPALMELVLTNLLGNAWKFTSKTEKAKIEFGARRENGHNVFFVRDNGPGFEAGHKKKLFMPFQRLHSEKEFEGTGIGLAIVERIIRAHGGKVCADGDLGKGVVVSFTVD
jgi:two-component system CheB/CheR fusion protein